MADPPAVGRRSAGRTATRPPRLGVALEAGSPIGIQTCARSAAAVRPERLPPVRPIHARKRTARRPRLGAGATTHRRRGRHAGTDGRKGFATRAIHAGERPDPTTHAHNTPIYATATFAFDTAAEKEAAVDAALEWDPTSYFYSRTGNPTNRALEEKIASLEGAEDAVVAASGMASVAATLFAHLGQGDHLVVGDELFVITRVLWRRTCRGAGSASRRST